jgi:hypothetical protein
VSKNLDDEYHPPVRCSRCGSTDVYWMTVINRREARFQHAISADAKWLEANKPRLYSTSGGEHVCPIDDPFEVLP